jgi:hypothetical protein
MDTLKRTRAATLACGIAIAAIVSAASPAMADHEWNRYKWREQPLDLVLVDNHSSADWSNRLGVAAMDWQDGFGFDGYRYPPVVILSIENGKNASCNPVSGNVQVCNGDYGETGWLGVASIWTRGTTIIAGTAKLNDTYHNYPPYNDSSWRQLVICQEVAHTFGLDHQDENFNNDNLGTCMDYTSSPEGNEHPNQHDYDQLELMYGTSTSEEDGSNEKTCNPKSPKCSAGVQLEYPNDWGRLVSGHGGVEVYEKELHNGFRVITHVTWTLEHAEDHNHRR